MQETYLQKELDKLKQIENRLAEITGSYEEILDSLSEEEKEADTVNEAKDSFVGAIVAKEAKQFQAEKNKNGAFAEDSYEAKILKVNELITEEKDLKKQLITETAKLHSKTKETIETLTDKQVV